MGYPRHVIAPPGLRATYHCVSRCVRRAFLCGFDASTGRDFTHRKRWMEARILQLGRTFAVAVHAYAILDNHFHIVLEVDPSAPQGWSDEEVARRWLQLQGADDAKAPEWGTRMATLCRQPERLVELRNRLGSLSWFMRALKEPIARRANAEDDCSGRFWEGRFRSQILLDEAALLSAMVYVDLNPARAGISASATSSPHTSIRRRVETCADQNAPLSPLVASVDSDSLAISHLGYRDLVLWTASSLGRGSEGPDHEFPTLPAALRLLPLEPTQWLAQVVATETRYWRAIGAFEAMVAHAAERGLRWLRGIGTARAIAARGPGRVTWPP